MKHVLVCRFCGHINVAEGSPTRCNKCQTFSGLATVPQAEAEQLCRRKRLRSVRSNLLRLTLAMTLAIAFTLWGARAFFDLGPSPPGATTRLSTSIGTQAWGQERRTPQNTGFTPDPAPHHQRVKWTYTTSEPLVASPAVLGDRIYLATENGHIVALERQTGQPVWEYHNGAPSNSTPTVAGNLLFLALRPGYVVALNRESGTLHWKRHVKSPILASPVVVDGTVYIGTADSKLYALDAATGKERWTFATKDWIISSVAYADDAVIVASKDGVMHVVSATTGRRRLVYDTGGSPDSRGSPAVQGDLAYVASLGGRVLAIDWQARSFPFDGALLYGKTNLYVWGVIANPPVQKGRVWVGQAGGDVMGTPALAHNSVYVAITQGEVVALDSTTGAHLWRTGLGVDITCAPTVAGTTVLVGTEDGTVFGLDANTGKIMWDFKARGKITGSPIVAGDTMYVVSHDGTLYAVGVSE